MSLDTEAFNYNEIATVDNELYSYVYGCTNSNYDELYCEYQRTKLDPYTYIYEIWFNYNAQVQVDDGSCIPIVFAV